MNDKIEDSLNETRILVLVVQVLLGFAYQSVFQTGFERLPRHSQEIEFISLDCMLITLVLLLAPTAYHRIVTHGGLNDRMQQFSAHVITCALLPFAVGLGGNILVAAQKILSPRAGVICGVAVFLAALFFWYGLESWIRTRENNPARTPDGANMIAAELTPLKDKIKFVLTELRIVLPGAQALLGFQFAAVLTESFDRLSRLAKDIHLVSLLCLALTAILLMAPAAYHRLVEYGEDTERLHSFASRMLLWAMALLAMGISGDVWVVIVKVFHSQQAATLASVVTLLVFYSFWFGYMLYCRSKDVAAAAAPALN